MNFHAKKKCNFDEFFKRFWHEISNSKSVTDKRLNFRAKSPIWQFYVAEKIGLKIHIWGIFRHFPWWKYSLLASLAILTYCLWARSSNNKLISRIFTTSTFQLRLVRLVFVHHRTSLNSHTLKKPILHFWSYFKLFLVPYNLRQSFA